MDHGIAESAVGVYHYSPRRLQEIFTIMRLSNISRRLGTQNIVQKALMATIVRLGFDSYTYGRSCERVFLLYKPKNEMDQ